MSCEKTLRDSSRYPLIRAVTAALALAVLGSSASAQNVFWDSGGGTDHNWSNAANWDTDTEPGIDNDVHLNNGGTIEIIETGEIGLTFRIGAAADTSLSPANLGLGGTVNFRETGSLATGPFIPSVDIGVAPGSTSVWNHHGGTLTTLELFRIGVDTGSTGTLNMHAGTIDVSTTDTDGLDFFLVGDNGNATMNMDGGVVRSRGLFSVALQPPSTSTLNMSGGSIQGNGDFIFGGNTNDPIRLGGHATVNLSGGSMKANNEVSFGNSHYAYASMNHSGGSLEGNGILIGKWTDVDYTLSGTGAIIANGQLNLATFTPIERPEGSVNAPLVTFTQSGTSTVTAAGLLVGEMGHAIYNLNGGSVHVTGVTTNGGTVPGPEFLNMLIGRDGGGHRLGLGEVRQTAGTVTVDTKLVLGDFDDSMGKYTISGGSLTVAGTAAIGAALATNAPADDVRLEPSELNGAQGQALNASGIFTVRGGAATISFGKLLANPADKGAFRSGPGKDNHATLAFEVGDSGDLTTINVANVADLDGAVIDLGFMASSTYVPAYQQEFVLVNAALFGPTGTGTTQNVGTGSNVVLPSADVTDWTVAVVPATGGRQSLVATYQIVPGDTNNNKIVNFDDLLVLAQNYNLLEGQTRATGDFNRTGSVNFDDLLILAQNYGFGVSGLVDYSGQGLSAEMAGDWALALSLVPEPTSMLTIAASCGLLVRRRRTSVAHG